MRIKTAHEVLSNDEVAAIIAVKHGRSVASIKKEARHSIANATKRDKRKGKKLAQIVVSKMMGEDEL